MITSEIKEVGQRAVPLTLELLGFMTASSKIEIPALGWKYRFSIKEGIQVRITSRVATVCFVLCKQQTCM